MEHYHRSPQQGGHQVLVATPPAVEHQEKFAEGNWSDIEKATLREAIESHQGHPIRSLEEVQGLSDDDKKLPFKWSAVSSYCMEHGCRRNAKQCRERYINHMAPLRRDRIAPHEGRRIMHLVAKHGKKWAWIGRELNRSENTLKNYWNQERKKELNGRRRNAPQLQPSHQAQADRQHSLPPVSYSQTLHERPHSRRESLCSNPGLISDHGSPIEASPRSSRHNSFAPVQQLPLHAFQGSKHAPASPLQVSYPMDRTQALSGSSAYGPQFQGDSLFSPTQEHLHQRSHPIFPHHSEGGYGFLDRRGQQVQHHRVDYGSNRADHGFEHSPYHYGQSQVRETYHDRSYPYTAPQHPQAPSQTSLPARSQRGTLPPVSSLMNLAGDIYDVSQGIGVPSVTNRPENTRAPSRSMAIRSILN